MNLPRHRIPEEMFARLAAGGGGAAAVRALSAVEYSKHLLLIRGVLDASRAVGHPQQHLARRAYDLLAAIQEHSPGAVDTIVRYPSVAAWAGRTVVALQTGRPLPGAEPGRLAALAAAAAIRARYPCVIEVPADDSVVTFPSLGQVFLPESTGKRSEFLLQSGRDGAAVTTGDRWVSIPDDPYIDAPGWRGLRQVAAQSHGKTIRLLIDDLDPFRLPTLSRATRLTAMQTQNLQSHLREAWDILVYHHHAIVDEVIAAITVLTPLESPEDGQSSASSRETFGCIGLSPPADPMGMAVTFAHEVQHAKLSALLDAVDLLHPDDGSLHYAPWRTDPRPIGGLLQGAYAYMGVTRFWHRQRHEATTEGAIQANAEFARWRSAVTLVIGTLMESGRLTPRGRTFVAGMAHTVRQWYGDPVPAEALTIAHQAAKRHLESWNRRYGSTSQDKASPRSGPTDNS